MARKKAVVTPSPVGDSGPRFEAENATVMRGPIIGSMPGMAPPGSDVSLEEFNRLAIKAVPSRVLRKGTRIMLPGGGMNTLFVLETDAAVSGGGIERDRVFVGILAANQTNWDLNASRVEGTWSPVTGQRQPDEPKETEE